MQDNQGSPYPLPAALMRGMSLCSVIWASLLLNISTRSRKLVLDIFFASSFSFSIFLSKCLFWDAVRYSAPLLLGSLGFASSVGFVAATSLGTFTLRLTELDPPPEPFNLSFPPTTKGFLELTTLDMIGCETPEVWRSSGHLRKG